MTRDKLYNEIRTYLEEAIKLNAEYKSKDSYYSAEYKYDPQKKKIGDYETRIATYADTTFTYRSRISDPATNLFNNFQTLYLDIGKLQASDIHHIYDSLLKEKNIYLESIIGITASYYTQLNDWSNDTTSIDINLRTEITDLGNYEDIDYYAYMHYSFYTIWRLMPKTIIFILFLCCLLSGLLLLWCVVQRNKIMKNGIILRKDGNYQIKDTIFYVNEKKLITNEIEIKLTTQLNDLFMLFLQAENHRVSKAEIKKTFWEKAVNATSNMTSTVNRLNTELKDAHCAYRVIKDPQSEKYYRLSDSSNGSSSLIQD